MATGIIGTLNGAGTITYTPNSPAKVKISNSGTGLVYVNGAAVINSGSSSVPNNIELWVGAGQTLTVTAAPQSGGALVVSALES